MKTSAIMIMLKVPKESIPAHELDIARRVLTQRIQGVDEHHHRRWLRRLNRLFAGEIQTFYPDVTRSGVFHARHMAIEGKVFHAQDCFPEGAAGQKAFRLWLKVGAALLHLELHPGEVKFVEGSLAYDELSDDEMREFHEAAMDFLRSPRALKKLWPAVKPAERMAMLEAALSKKTEEHA